MEICVNDINKTVEIWLSKSESYNDVLRTGLKPLFADYKSKKYIVAVFESGNGSLLENTKNLIKHNRTLNKN